MYINIVMFSLLVLCCFCFVLTFVLFFLLIAIGICISGAISMQYLISRSITVSSFTCFHYHLLIILNYLSRFAIGQKKKRHSRYYVSWTITATAFSTFISIHELSWISIPFTAKINKTHARPRQVPLIPVRLIIPAT